MSSQTTFRMRDSKVRLISYSKKFPLRTRHVRKQYKMINVTVIPLKINIFLIYRTQRRFTKTAVHWWCSARCWVKIRVRQASQWLSALRTAQHQFIRRWQGCRWLSMFRQNSFRRRRERLEENADPHSPKWLWGMPIKKQNSFTYLLT